MKVNNSFNSIALGTMVSDMGCTFDFSFFRVFYLCNVNVVFFEAASDDGGVMMTCFTQRFHDIFDIVRARAQKKIESFIIKAYECE